MPALLIISFAGVSAVTGCFSGKFFNSPCQTTNSCGGGGSGANSSYAYVANASGSVAGFPLPTAAFTSISGTAYVLGSPLSALAASPKGTFVYVATTAGPVLLYTIGTNGALTVGNNGTAVTSTLTPTWITIDPTGNWLFLLSTSINALLEYQINTTTGILTQVGATSGIPISAGVATQVYVTANDQNVYVGVGLGGFDAFTFNSTTGALSNPQHMSAQGGGAAITFGSDPNSKFLFVGEAGRGIRSFSIGSGGTLTEVSGSPFTSPLGPSSIVVDPTSKYVYVANKTAGVITGYTLAANGGLTELSSSPFQAGTGPNAMSLDTTGKYLLVTSSGGGPDLEVFSFDVTTPGKLDPVASATTGTDPTNPVALSVVQ